ncbi:MAG TPA: site-specific DNA-methyltransferase, partial [Methanocella sp.]
MCFGQSTLDTSASGNTDETYATVSTREAPLKAKYQAKIAAWKRQPDILKTAHDFFEGDSRLMEGLDPEREVHLIVTSPPYWNLKKYSDEGEGLQLGHIDDREEFMQELGKVWENCYRHLVPGGRLCVVVGDVCRSRKKNGRHLVDPLHSYIQVQCQGMGFDPLAPIIWNKISNVATEVNGNGSVFLGKPYEPNGIIKNDIEYILNFRKPGGYRHPTQEQRDLSLIDRKDHEKWFQQIWTDVPGELQRGHPAPFPVEVASRLIGMFSFVGDTVLDPFAGTGNTTQAAIMMHRNSIGFELEPGYIKLAEKRFRNMERPVIFH